MKRIKKNSCITILGREWTRSNGSNIQNAQIYINNEYLLTTPVKSGYEQHYVQIAIDEMIKHRYLNDHCNYNTWRLTEKYGYKFLCHCEYVNKERDLYNVN